MEDKILARVKKMMAIANDAAATEQERDTALQMAYRVLAKYNLSMVDVDSHMSQEKRDSLQAIFVSTIWSRNVAAAIADLFFCKYIIGRKTNAWKGVHYFVGKESNATTAMMMSEYVVTSILKQARKLYRDDSCPEARSFAVGAVSALRVKVSELKRAEQAEANSEKPGNALVLADMYASEKAGNDEYMKLIGFETKPKSTAGKSEVNSDAYGAGKSFGKSINLAPQVGTSASRTKMLK